MADALTEVEIEALHDAIESGIKTAFPALQTVQFYREETDRVEPVATPACLLSIDEFNPTPDKDPGTGQLATEARFSARLILGFRTERAKIEARKLACAIAAYLHLRRWPGVVTGPGDVSAIMPDEFDPALDQFEVWRVEWSHAVHLGESVWKGEGVTPTVVDVRYAHPEGDTSVTTFRLVGE